MGKPVTHFVYSVKFVHYTLNKLKLTLVARAMVFHFTCIHRGNLIGFVFYKVDVISCFFPAFRAISGKNRFANRMLASVSFWPLLIIELVARAVPARLTLFWTGGGKFASPAGFLNIAQKPLGLGS